MRYYFCCSSRTVARENFLWAWRILINTNHCDVRLVHALANHKSQFCLYWEWRKVYIIFWFGLLVCIIFLQWQDPCNDDGMNINNTNNKNNINNTMTKLSDNNSIGTSKLGLFMGSVCTQLFCLLTTMRRDIVLATSIQEYAYDIILKALFVFNCSILFWIVTIDGEY